MPIRRGPIRRVLFLPIRRGLSSEGSNFFSIRKGSQFGGGSYFCQPEGIPIPRGPNFANYGGSQFGGVLFLSIRRALF